MRHRVPLALLVCTLIANAALAADRRLPEPLYGPPPVSCWAWAIADGKTGRVLWGSNVDEKHKAASTTKMMCALVVLELANENPSVLDEWVTFSELADKTGGSTSTIEAGESVTVRELLYGLLLPSGNDAGNALAEHFNDRFDPPAYPDDTASAPVGEKFATRANFLAQMNRKAQELGMADTFYRNAYGDGGTSETPTTSAHDLVRLAHYAMQNPLFREYVGTAEHVGQVRRPDGSTREITWKNTNRLLGYEGYDGIKTGSTKSAGRCLVSRGNRGDDQLIVVVLGSTSNDSRYLDARNLYRWAWQQLGHTR